MEFLKKHLFESITVGLLVLVIVLMFCGDKVATLGGIFLIAAIVMTVVTI